MPEKACLAALDAGAVSISLAVIDDSGRLLEGRSVVHEGRIAEGLDALVAELRSRGITRIVRSTDTGSSLDDIPAVDARLALIEGAKASLPELRSILHVGAERFYLLRFNEDGTYRDLRGNSSCAAGTGGFLDQQARRLALSGSAELGERAEANMNKAAGAQAPKIASRCSVFAKTDLIHAQQEGYGLDEICDGLCRGLSATIADSVFTEPPPLPLVFTGGVSLNAAVRRALEERLGASVHVPERSNLVVAIGAALIALREGKGMRPEPRRAEKKTSAASPSGKDRALHYHALALRYSSYPDFGGRESFLFAPDWSRNALPVETELYAELPSGKLDAHLGIDVGSTSTKAILVGRTGEPLAGFYTRTSGRPLDATRSILQAASVLASSRGTELAIRGCATTGSGRKFIGAIVGADLALDEISAHARAAVSLDPAIDTIVEIGGQDAKFTTLRNGVVTFSRMNTVCAAGTGSFIEEQAQKLGVPLSEYSERAMGVRAPLASDRCTVFMERDINHYLALGYPVEEILAAVLFSVRENYMLKVAETGAIGRRVCFQGATARNKALVAAFEERLRQPIFVSPYCHLTGALGAALALMEEGRPSTSFRGLDLYKESIPMETEVCQLCRNHCRIRVADVAGTKVAFGFLCGRDYDTKKFVATATTSFDEARRKALEAASGSRGLPVMGIPAGLQNLEELPLWKAFFEELGLPWVSSEACPSPIALGKKATGAEFCAPITAFHGHVLHLAGKAGALFLPAYLERKEEAAKHRTRKYCYYSQFAAALLSPVLDRLPERPRIVSPLFTDRSDEASVTRELHRALASVYGDEFPEAAVARAWAAARKRQKAYQEALKSSYQPPSPGTIKVVLLGRPYTVLAASMNKGIPGIFSSQGAEVLYQDMLPYHGPFSAELEALLDQVHWNYASEILRAAEFCARNEGLYPVFITSFKCAPDSFIQEYLERVMDGADKPYLTLQLDEHDSSVGYETRIEAALRSFRNHRAASAFDSSSNNAPRLKGRGGSASLPLTPAFERSVKGKKILLPCWDPVTMRLLAASLRHEGYDAEVLEETPASIAEGLKTNTGQCIPLNVIAFEYADWIKKRGIEPERCVLWMIKAQWACNIGMYPSFIKSILEKMGGGLERAGVYVGDLTMIELGPLVTGRAYFAYLFGGLLARLSCRVRPYETQAGETDAAAAKALEIFEEALAGKRKLRAAAREVVSLFASVERDESGGRKPKVAIFGDLYVRDNPVMNQDLVKAIERAGGEVVVTPYTEYTKIVSSGHFKKWIKEQKVPKFVLFRALLGALEILEGSFSGIFGELSGPTIHYEKTDLDAILSPYGMRLEQEGETYDNILKVSRLVRAWPDLSLLVQASPAFCCPSLVTEALASRIEEVTGIPMVNIIYDGTGAAKNDNLAPYLRYPRRKKAATPT